MHPGISVLFSYYPAARSEVECRACTREMHRLHLSPFPFLSFPLSYKHSCLSPRTRFFFVHLYVRLFPSSGISCPSATTSSFFLPLPLFLSRHLFLCFSTGLFPLSAARLVELFFVCRASLLYRCYARRRSLVESRPAKESLRSLRSTIARTARHSPLIAPNVRGIPNCVRLTRVKSHDFHALTLVTRGANAGDETFLNPGAAPRRKASGPIDARKYGSIVEGTDNFSTVIEKDFDDVGNGR